MKKLEINIPIYEQQIIVLKADDLKTIDNYIEDCYSTSIEAGDCRDASTYVLPNNVIIIGLTTSVTDKVIVHEAGHAVYQFMRNIGSQDEETFCYVQEFIFDKIVTWNTNG
jgi:hypothetical protein